MLNMLNAKLEQEVKIRVQDMDDSERGSDPNDESLVLMSESDAVSNLMPLNCQKSQSSERSRVSRFSKRAPVAEFIQSDDNKLTVLNIEKHFTKADEDKASSDSDVSINSAIKQHLGEELYMNGMTMEQYEMSIKGDSSRSLL
jgi:hypothetical protein